MLNYLFTNCVNTSSPTISFDEIEDQTVTFEYNNDKEANLTRNQLVQNLHKLPMMVKHTSINSITLLLLLL